MSLRSFCVLGVFLLILIGIMSSATADWYDWDYRKRITIDSGQVSANLTNFPVCINITDSDLASGAQSDGDDFLFTDSSDIKLEHEIEYWNSTTGELIVWVNITTLSSDVDTSIYMYYGNDGCGNQENASQIFEFGNTYLSNGKHTIENDFGTVYSVYACDMDGDGDIDVLSASLNYDDIAWWENDGSESFTKHMIDGSFNGARSVYACDIDGDDDIDVLCGGYMDDDIAWWENDGSESFTKHMIDSFFDGVYSVYACDVDGDGDIDVLGAAAYADDITWWENDGSESFTEHTIDGSFDFANGVYACDVDGDDDIDVLGTAANADDITWWENDGSESFTKHTIDGWFDGARGLYAYDVDGDGDIDVLGAAINADDITWWENTNGDGSSWTEHTIDGSFNYASSVYACDVDGDGDIDVLGAAADADDITWWENDGSESFTEHTIDGSFDGAASVYACDVDGDGDIDVLGAASNAYDIVWWESRLTLPVDWQVTHDNNMNNCSDGGFFTMGIEEVPTLEPTSEYDMSEEEMEAFTLLVLFGLFFGWGYTATKPSGGALLVISGFLLLSTAFTLTSIYSLLGIPSIYILFMGFKKWLYFDEQNTKRTKQRTS